MPGSVRSLASASSTVSRSRVSANVAARTMARERAGSMWSLSHSHDGTRRMVSAPGWTQSRSSRPGPGARSPYRWTSRRNPANASWPVTFCSMIAGDQGLEHPVAGAEPQVRPAAPGLGHQRMVRLESGGVVVGAEHRRHVVEGPGRSGTPGLGEHLAVPGPGATRSVAGPVGRADAAPHLVAVHPERRVARRAAAGRGSPRADTPSGPPHPPPPSRGQPTPARRLRATRSPR